MPRATVSEEQLRQIGLSEVGVAYILEAQESPPARKVGISRRRNLVFEVPMRNLPELVLQAESLTGEFMYLMGVERQEDVLAVLDQPTTIPISIVDRRGRKTYTTYTADYLVVSTKTATAVEIKADEEIASLILERPSDWIVDKGRHRFLPAERAFEERGISHIVVPTSALNTLLVDNLRILSNARYCEDNQRYRKIRKGVMTLMDHQGVMKLSDIMERIGESDESPIYQLIDQGKLYAALDIVTLTDAKSVWISKDEALCRATQVATQSIVEAALAQDLELSDLIDPRYEKDVALRHAVVNGIAAMRRDGKPVSDRTARRYRKAAKDGDGDVKALEPKWANCGPQGMCIGRVHQSYLNLSIKEGRSDPSDPTVSSCYGRYFDGFKDAKLELDFMDDRPVSRATYYRHWKNLKGDSLEAFSRGGRRLANQCADAYTPSKKTILATRPFSVAHIDHWKVDLHLKVGEVEGKVLSRRPWLTAMVDSHEKEVLAIWLSFDDPSKKACTMVIRDCVRRHGRLPEIIIVDGGSDFRSAHFSVMLATLGVVRGERPPEDPRFGQEVERIFLLFKERFARGLPGYGISIERSRAVSAAFKASKMAKLTLMEAFEALEAFIFDGYNHSSAPRSSYSRHSLRVERMERNPHSGRVCSWNLRFLVATSIEAYAAQYKLTPGRGLHVNDCWYSAPALMRYRGFKQELKVRLEPYADSVIYVWIDERWVVCARSDAPLQAAMGERSLLFSSAERAGQAAIRREIQNEHTRSVSRIINAKLEEISSRATSRPDKAVDHAVDDCVDWYGASYNFDDIEPYENEAP